MSNSLRATELYTGITLWTPNADELHDPTVLPQNPGCDEVLLGRPYGECGGVQMAVKVVETLGRVAQGRIYGNHEPTHGADSTKTFIELGARFGVMPEEVPEGGTYVISAHGASPSTLRAAEERGLSAYDVTCPLVYKTHQAILGAAALRNPHVAYISFGSPRHAERVGAAGAAEEMGIPFTAIANESDALQLVEDVEDETSIVVVGQTTNNSDEAEQLAIRLHEAAAVRGLDVTRVRSDTCHTVRDRQQATREIVARGVGTLIVVGAVASKNTLSLAKVGAEEAKKQGSTLDVYLVNSSVQLARLSRFDGVIGVVSGASTRTQNVKGVVEYLAPEHGHTFVGQDTDGDVIFKPVHAKTRQLLESTTHNE